MVSLRSLQSTSSVTEAGNLAAPALTSATESTSSTGTTSLVTTSAPSSSFKSVTTKKETTSSGGVITTVTTTTSTVSRSSNASSNTASSSSTSNTANASGTTSESNTATEGEAGNVSITTITTTEGENGSAPVTTVTTENSAKTTRTSTTKDSSTGLTTVTTTTESDTDMNGSASSSTTRVTTSSGSSGGVSTTERSTTSETSNAAGSSAFGSTTTAASSAGATIEGASSTTSTSTSTTTEGNAAVSITETNNGSPTSTTTSTGGNSASTTSGAATGSTTSGVDSATATASSSIGASSTTPSSTTTSTSTGSANGNTIGTATSSDDAAGSATTSSAATSLTNGATTATASSGESSATTTATTSSSTGTNSATVSTDGSKTSSSDMESSTTATSSEGSASSGKTDSSSKTTSSSNSSSSSSSSLTSWFTSSFRDEETQLVVGATGSTTTAGDAYQVCDGLPALVTRSSNETPNGGCPDELTALNASCTCLTGYSEIASSWVFHVTTESWNSSTSTTTRSLTQSSSDELAITTIRPIWVSSSLETLVIEGAGDAPADLEFIDENRVASGSSLTLVRSASNSSNVSTLSFYNVDLNSVAAKNSDFVPATVTNLTVRNCNISTLSTSFTHDWSSIQYLDLSSNNIETEYVGSANLKELNLSHNALAVFPSRSLNSSGLEALYIQGNAITDFNVSQEQFEQIQGLTAFTSDKAESPSTCQDGAWQSVHGTTFCVLGAATAAMPDSSRSSASGSDDDNDGLGLLAYWFIAGAIIVFFLLLLVIWQRRRHSRESESSPIVSPEAVEPTTPKYNGNYAISNALNHDAIATTSVAAAPAAVSTAAVPAATGVYAGYGRSHGNSVDSEDTALGVSLTINSVLTSCRLDYAEVTLGRCISRGGFGLVFVASYRGRQVAVKKIRNERDVEREQVEQFVREISLISGLSHPRIVEFIGACWTTPAELSAVTELMERGDLRDVTRRFKRRGYRLTWEAHKTVIALHIAEALTYLHGLSPTVIHRDLKAKNVMLNADMEAKLSDFGIARERSLYDGSEHMTVGIGTSFWIAPEVLLGRDYDERADIYSFGVVLSEIDTDDYPYWNAQHPPQGKVQENEILRLVARGAKRPAFSDDCPPAILELAARCLRSDPEERPSASEIMVYLQQLVQDRNSSARFPSMRNSFDFNSRSSNNSPPAPANTIVNLRSSGQQIQQNQAITVSSSSAAACATGKHTKKTTTTTTSTRVSSSSTGSDTTSSFRPTATQALATSHEEVESSPQVTHQVVHTKLPSKGKRTTTTTTTTRRSEQGNTGGITGGHFTTGVSAGSSDGDGRGFGRESVASSQSYAGLPDAGPTSPTNLRANHQAALDNLNQKRQLGPSGGQEDNNHEAFGIDRQGQEWAVYRYEDVREL